MHSHKPAGRTRAAVALTTLLVAVTGLIGGVSADTGPLVDAARPAHFSGAWAWPGTDARSGAVAAAPGRLADDGSSSVSLLDAAGGGGITDIDFAPHDWSEPPVSRRVTVSPGGSMRMALDEVDGLADGAHAVRIVSGFGSVAGVSTVWTESRGASSYLAPAAATELVVPFATKHARGQTTYVSISNPDLDTAATATLQAVETLEAEPTAFGEIDLPPGGTVGFWLGEPPLDRLPDGWLGTLRISAEVPLNAHAWVSDELGGAAVFDSSGVPVDQGSAEWFIPRVVAHAGPAGAGVGPGAGEVSTRIAIANPSSRIAVLVTAEMYGSSGSCAGETYTSATKTVRAGSNVIFDLGPSPGRKDYDVQVPEGCVATARIFTSLGEVVVAVVEERLDGESGRVLAASGFSASAAPVSGHAIAPTFVGPAGEGLAAITALNAGGAASEIAIELFDSDGRAVACSGCAATLAARTSRTWDTDDLGLPAGLGQLTVRARSPGGAVAVLIDELPFGGDGDGAAHGSAPAEVAAAERLAPVALRSWSLGEPPVDPTPTASNTPSDSPTRPPYPGPPTVGTPPTLIPTRTSTPTATAVPTEVPLGDISLTNLGAEPADVRLRMVDRDGTTSLERAFDEVAGHALAVLSLEEHAADLGARLHGGAVDLGGPSGSFAAMALHRARRGAAAAYVAPESGTDLIVPMALIDYFGASTSLAVQNASDAPTTVRVALHGVGRSSASRRPSPVVLQPGASVGYRLGTDIDFAAVPPNTPDGFVGWLRVTADRPVAAMAVVDESGSDRKAYTISGVPIASASRTGLAPAFLDGYGGVRSQVLLFNPADTDVEARLVLRAVGGLDTDTSCELPPTGEMAATVPALGIARLGLGGDGPERPGCVFSARVEADGDVIASAVLERGSGPDGMSDAAAAYPLRDPGAASVRVALPRVRFDLTGPSSRVFAMNVGTEPADVRLRLWDGTGAELSGCGGACEAPVPAGGGYAWRLDDIARELGLAEARPLVGSAELESDAGIVAAVVDDPADQPVDLQAFIGVAAGGAPPPRHLPLTNWTIKPGFVVGPTPTATPWPTATPRPTLYPGSGARDVIALQNKATDGVLELALVQLFSELGSPDTLGLALFGIGPSEMRMFDSRVDDFGSVRRSATVFSVAGEGSSGAEASIAHHLDPDGAVTAQNVSYPGVDLIVPWIELDRARLSTELTLFNSGFGAGIPVDPVGPGGPLPEDALAASVSLHVFGADSPVAEMSLEVPPQALRVLDVADSLAARVPEGTGNVGWLRVRNPSTPLSVEAIVGTSDSAAAYSVAARPAELVTDLHFAPYIPVGTGRVELFNPWTEPIGVTADSVAIGGACTPGRTYPHIGPPIDVAPFDKSVFDPADSRTGAPPGCVVAARLRSADGQFFALAIEAGPSGEHLAAYSPFTRFEVGRGSSVPLAFAGLDGRSTDVYLMRAEEDGSGEPGEVRLELIDRNGRRVTGCDADCTKVLAPGEAAVWRIRDLEGVPPDFVGGATITSDAPIAVVVRDTPIEGTGDSAIWRGYRTDVTGAEEAR